MNLNVSEFNLSMEKTQFFTQKILTEQDIIREYITSFTGMVENIIFILCIMFIVHEIIIHTKYKDNHYFQNYKSLLHNISMVLILYLGFYFLTSKIGKTGDFIFNIGFFIVIVVFGFLFVKNIVKNNTFFDDDKKPK